MATYGNPHILPPVQCSSNTPTWIDPTLTANDTLIRKVHIDELRSYVNNELSRRGIATFTFTDSTITANSTKIRDDHITELRHAIDTHIKRGDCSADTYYCPQDTSGTISWTDSTITYNSTLPRTVHITEMRTAITNLMATCICEAEQCQYCADCGYAYQLCSHSAVACDNHKYVECANYYYWVYACGSTNLATGTAHPYKAVSETTPNKTAWDGTVPWNMCNYAPPGSNWGSCEYQTGHDHSSDWNCKCNPFTWS